MVRLNTVCCALLILLTLPLTSAQAKQTPLSTPVPRSDPAYRDREVILQSGIIPRTPDTPDHAPPTLTKEDFLRYTAEIIRALRKMPVEELKEFQRNNSQVFPMLVRLLQRFASRGNLTGLSNSDLHDFGEMQSQLFIPLDHWAYSALSNLLQKDLITGSPDNPYSFNNRLTRKQFADAIAEYLRNTGGKPTLYWLSNPDYVRTLQALVNTFAPELQRLLIDTASLLALKSPPDVSFTDETNKRHWAYYSVKRVGRMGILRGYPNGAFRIKNTD